MQDPDGGPDPRADRAAVLEAARRLLAAGERPTIGRIARSTGVRRRAVRASFATEDQVVEAVAVAVMHRLVGQHPSLHPIGAEDDWRRMMTAIWDDAAVVRALLVEGRRRGDPALRDLLQPLLWSKTAIIARGQEEGCFRTDVAAEALGALAQRLCLAALLEHDGTLESATDRTLSALQPARG